MKWSHLKSFLTKSWWMLSVHKSPCKSRGVFSILCESSSMVCPCFTTAPRWITFLSRWNYRRTWAESNKWPFQATLITSGELLTQNTDMSIKIPNLSHGNYLCGPQTIPMSHALNMGAQGADDQTECCMYTIHSQSTTVLFHLGIYQCIPFCTFFFHLTYGENTSLA